MLPYAIKERKSFYINMSIGNNDLQIIEIENYRPEPEIDRDGNITHSASSLL